MNKTVVTKKGSVLPLMKLKGKDYLLVAHRLQWLSDEHPNFTIKTEFLKLTDEDAIAQTTLTIYNESGNIVRQTMATKRETKKDFSDFIEKAETGSQGRALAAIGLGTQMALSDLDEGARIVDAPVQDPKELVVTVKEQELPKDEKGNDIQEQPKKASSFRKAKTEVKKEVTPEQEAEWG